MKKLFAALLLLFATEASAQNYLRDDGIFHSVVEGTTNNQIIINSGGTLAGTTVLPNGTTTTTQSPGDNTSKVATDAFVQAATSPATASPQLYVNHSTGSDTSNNCLNSLTPCATIQNALTGITTNLVRSNVGFTVFPTINTDCGFTENVTASGTSLALNGAVRILASASPCVWTGVNGNDKGSVIVLNGYTLRTAGSGDFWSVSKGGILVLINEIMSSAVGGSFVNISDGGTLSYDAGTHQLGDGAACSPNCLTYAIKNHGGTYKNATNNTVTVPNALTFTAFYLADNNAAQTNFQGTLTFTGTGSGAGSTGAKYILSNSATLDTVAASTTFPGATAGINTPQNYINNANAPFTSTIQNSSAGANAEASWNAQASGGGASFGAASSGYNPGGNLNVVANKAFVYSAPALSGIGLYADGTNPINFYTNSGSKVSGFDGSTGALTLAVQLAVAQGGTNCAAASGTCLDNITGFSSTGYINRTGAGTYTFTAAPSPGGTAGGDLSGTYPNPTLAAIITAGGPTGSATVAPIITYDAKGRLTAVSSATITPVVGSITGLGTGVATALGVNVGTAGSFVVNGGALGAPSSGTVTNLTGTASININGTVGATTPTTGAFTTVVASTSVSSPIHTAAAALTFQSNGSTFAGDITTGQQWFIGSTLNTPPTGPQLTISKNVSALPALGTPTGIIGTAQAVLTVAGVDGSPADINVQAFGAQPAALRFFHAANTAASPTATQSGTVMGDNVFYGFKTAGGNAYVAAGGIVGTSTDNYTAAASGFRMDFYATDAGTTGIVNVAQFTGSTMLIAGHILASGSVPSVSSCGTLPGTPTGSDNFGKVVAGTGVLSSCVINFAKTWGAAPSCSVSSPTAIASLTVTTSTTQLTIGGTSLTGDALAWTCGSSSWLIDEPANDNINPGIYSRIG